MSKVQLDREWRTGPTIHGVCEKYAPQRREEAVQAAQDALRIKPDSGDPYYLLGCASHEPETYLEAVAAYEKSLELNPGQLEVAVNLGDAFLHLDRPEDARKILTRMGTLESDDAKLHHSLAELYLKLGLRDEALREHDTLRRLDPSLADAFAKLLNGTSSVD